RLYGHFVKIFLLIFSSQYILYFIYRSTGKYSIIHIWTVFLHFLAFVFFCVIARLNFVQKGTSNSKSIYFIYMDDTGKFRLSSVCVSLGAKAPPLILS